MKRLTITLLAAILVAGIYSTAEGANPSSLARKALKHSRQAVGQSNRALEVVAGFENKVDALDKQTGANAQSIEGVAQHLNGTDARVAALGAGPFVFKTVLDPLPVGQFTRQAVCPDGARRTGGGYSIEGEPSNVKVLASEPNGNNGWSVHVTNPGPQGKLTVEVVCVL